MSLMVVTVTKKNRGGKDQGEEGPPERRLGEPWGELWEGHSSGGGHSLCKGPEAGPGPACWRKNKGGQEGGLGWWAWGWRALLGWPNTPVRLQDSLQQQCRCGL